MLLILTKSKRFRSFNSFIIISNLVYIPLFIIIIIIIIIIIVIIIIIIIIIISNKDF